MNKPKKVFDRNIEPLSVRKARRAEDAPMAIKEYRERTDATLDRMAKLRAERLAREKEVSNSD